MFLSARASHVHRSERPRLRPSSIGVAVLVYPDGTWYGQVRAEDVREIIEEHLENGRVVDRLALIEVKK